MSESISPWNVQSSSPPGGLEAAASEFRSKVEDAASRLNGAAQQFVSMSEGFAQAIDEARQAADRAQAAQKSVEEMRERLERDYGVVAQLVADLQDRISALATLARPMPAALPTLESVSSEPDTAEPSDEQAVQEPVSIGYETAASSENPSW